MEKRAPKTVTFADFKCQESYNGLVDNGICRTLGIPAPDLVSPALTFFAYYCGLAIHYEHDDTRFSA